MVCYLLDRADIKLLKCNYCERTNVMTMIDPSTVIPLYYQIKEDLMKEIETGKWAVGEMIPSEIQLAHKYNVSRNTTQRAINDLVHDGILSRRQGIGTFVVAPKIEQALNCFYSFSQVMRSQGIPTSTKVVSLTREKATSSQAKYLLIPTGEDVFVLKRIRYANGIPFMLDSSRIPVTLAPDIDSIDFEQNSLYEVLEQKYNICVSHAKEIFEPVIINKQESIYLAVDENSPAIMLDRVAFSSKDEPVELCRSIIPGDKCRFYTELR